MKIRIIKENKQRTQSLPEGLASELGHVALDIAGLVPQVGELADIANAVWYVREGEKHKNAGDNYEAFFAYLFAALSVTSLAGAVFPVVGDLIPKTAKYAAQAARFAKFSKKGGQKARALRDSLRRNKPMIDKIIKKAASKENRLSRAVPEMLNVLEMFISGEIPERPESRTTTLRVKGSSDETNT